MTSEQSGVEVTHLRCDECVHIVNVARFDGVAKLVCHCTHVDGEIDPVPLNEMEILPDRWDWVPTVKP